MDSLTSVVCANGLRWQKILGQSQREDIKIGGAAFGRPTILSMLSLASAMDFIPRQPPYKALKGLIRQPITTDY